MSYLMKGVKMLNKMKLWDKILICTLTIISVGWIVFTMFFYSNEGNKTIEIIVDGNLVEKLFLTEEDENIYNFQFGENTGYIEIKNGAVRMLEMDREICPESICSKTGWIKEVYETIVCLPNNIIVKVNGSNDLENDIDILV